MNKKISQKFENLENGDLILFNDRKEPLEVKASYNNGSVIVKSSRGTRYHLVQNKHNPSKIGVISLGNTIYSDKGWIEELQVVEKCVNSVKLI